MKSPVRGVEAVSICADENILTPDRWLSISSWSQHFFFSADQSADVSGLEMLFDAGLRDKEEVYQSWRPRVHRRLSGQDESRGAPTSRCFDRLFSSGFHSDDAE
jgi:hypothetical protein